MDQKHVITQGSCKYTGGCKNTCSSFFFFNVCSVFVGICPHYVCVFPWGMVRAKQGAVALLWAAAVILPKASANTEACRCLPGAQGEWASNLMYICLIFPIYQRWKWFKIPILSVSVQRYCALLGVLGMLGKAFCLLINSNAARSKVAWISLHSATLCQVDLAFRFSPRGQLLVVNIYFPARSCKVTWRRYRIALAGQLQCHPVPEQHVGQHK